MAYPDDSVPIFRPDGSLRTLLEIEDAVFDHALLACGGSASEAARRLGVGRATVYRKMRTMYGADRDM